VGNADKMSIIWSDYIMYRMNLRKFDQTLIEEILRYSEERYFDVVTHRWIVIDRHNKVLIMIPYECSENKICPVTIHATTRGQIKFRIKTGRFQHE
jgi:hypothetical protein